MQRLFRFLDGEVERILVCNALLSNLVEIYVFWDAVSILMGCSTYPVVGCSIILWGVLRSILLIVFKFHTFPIAFVFQNEKNNVSALITFDRLLCWTLMRTFFLYDKFMFTHSIDILFYFFGLCFMRCKTARSGSAKHPLNGCKAETERAALWFRGFSERLVSYFSILIILRNLIFFCC